jgi:hypothetical protein
MRISSSPYASCATQPIKSLAVVEETAVLDVTYICISFDLVIWGLNFGPQPIV